MMTLDEIRQAQQRLRGVAYRTPLVPYPRSDEACALYLKAENLQPIGSFKIRGAYNKVASLTEAERARGVVAHSSGNHAQAVAYAARAFGCRSIIVMPQNAPAVKLEATRALGAEVVLVENSSTARFKKVEQLVAEHGYARVEPYNDLHVMGGQGTIGLEILDDLPEVELALVPVSGGGLISGIAAALKLSRPSVRVIGVEPEFAADARDSFRAGHLVEYTPEQVNRTLADGLRVQKLAALTFEHIRLYVDDIVTVTEAEIRAAMRRLALQAWLVAEPSGAVTTAAFLFHRHELPRTRNAVAVISGGNVEAQLLAEVLSS
jgi:threonine dehydratase